MKKFSFLFTALFTALFLMSAPSAMAGSYGNPCNPCSMQKGMKQNPCNPCGMKVKGNPCNPCSMQKGMKQNPCNPCGMKGNPCNPCNASGVKRIRHEQVKDLKALIKRGEKLWNNSALSSNGLNCMSCHSGNRILRFDKAFPHYVKMPDDIVTFDQMVNFCLINPMASSEINPDSADMTAFAAYYQFLKNPGKYGQ